MRLDWAGSGDVISWSFISERTSPSRARSTRKRPWSRFRLVATSAVTMVPSFFF
jgi:hypothetical protein